MYEKRIILDVTKALRGEEKAMARYMCAVWDYNNRRGAYWKKIISKRGHRDDFYKRENELGNWNG